MPPRRTPLVAALILAAAGAPAAGLGQVAPSPHPATLPAIAPVEGPLAITVVYPPAGALVGARDSSFLFGATGSGSGRRQAKGKGGGENQDERGNHVFHGILHWLGVAGQRGEPLSS
jgi:hypothetical protein